MRQIIVAGILSIIGLLLLGLAYRVLFKTSGPHTQTEAICNAKSLHIALLDFHSDYGSFPGTSTISAVKADTGTSLALGNASSNEVFRQLLATVDTSESFYWTKSTITPRKPDNNILGGHALEKGECAFAYVTGLSALSDSTTPVAIAPVIPSKRCFERRKDYGNKAIILFVSGAVQTIPIDRHGKVQLNGMDFFDPRQSFWKGKAPDIKWPE